MKLKETVRPVSNARTMRFLNKYDLTARVAFGSRCDSDAAVKLVEICRGELGYSAHVNFKEILHVLRCAWRHRMYLVRYHRKKKSQYDRFDDLYPFWGAQP